MKNVLCIVSGSLSDPKRGTPLRTLNELRQVTKKHRLLICSTGVPEEFKGQFIPYPSGSPLVRLMALRAIVRKEKIDVVFAATETSITIPVLLKLLTGVRIAIDLHGLLADEALASGHINRLQYLLLRIKVPFLLNFYDTVFAVSRKLAGYYGHARDWVPLYGGVVALPAPVTLRETLESGVRIGYMGNPRPYQGLPYIIEAAARLKNEGIPVRLNLIVSGDRQEVEALVGEHGLTAVTELCGNVSHEEANRRILDSDVLPIARPSVSITEYAYPSKLTEYLATGIPVITTDVGPVEEMRGELERCCVIIAHDDIAGALADALREFSRSSLEERRAFGSRAHEYVAKALSWDTLGDVINSALDS